MYRNYLKLAVVGATALMFSLNSFGQKCTKFIDYQNKTFNTKGLSMQIFGQPVGIGGTEISTVQRTASEQLQRLDLLQYNICEQLKNIKTDFMREKLQAQYSNLLMKMLRLQESGEDVAPVVEQIANLPANKRGEAIAIQDDSENTPVVTKEEQPTAVEQPVFPASPISPTSRPCEAMNFKSDKETIRALGYGESKNRNMAKDYAVSAALEGLALSMEVTVKVVGEHYRLSTRKELDENFEERLEKTTQTSIKQTIRNINIVCEGDVRNPNTNNWEYYIVYEVGREDAVKELFNSLQKDPVVKETVPNYERFKQTFNEVMKEYDKSEEISFDE